MATVHNNASKGDIARTVLMPGDPLRAKFIAETYLEEPRCFNEVRGMLGYTGTYKGTELSVMGSGMGMPSIGIYSYELFHFYDVDNIIRIGSAGALQADMKLMDLVFAIGACTNSAYGAQYGLGGSFSPTASFGLLEKAVASARKAGAVFHVGNVLSSDVFYSGDGAYDGFRDMGVLAVEMEAAALYYNAAEAKKNALAMMTISDHIYGGESLSPADRQESFRQMMEVALETVRLGDGS